MMKRLWTTSSGLPERQWHSPPWTCQLMHIDVTDDYFVFDFIALEPPPTSGHAVPAGSPFSMHVGHGGTSVGVAGLVEHVLEWAADADVVTLFGGRHDGSSWLCLSSNETHLVVELA